MKNKFTAKKPRREIHPRKNQFKVLLFKGGIRLGFVLLFCLIFYTIKSGITHLFFSSNPHFTLKNVDIEIVKGIFTEDDIKKKITFKIGETNLFSIDPETLRKQILGDTLVQEIEVRRLLPDSLNLIVFGRTPIAQIISRGGNLIDSDGIVLRPSQKSEIQKLPIITGVAGVKNYTIGQKLDHPFVLKAIQFLKLKKVITNGNWLNIHLIQLNENYNELRVYLNENKQCFVREGAQLILPTENTKDALVRAMAILERRVQAHQPTSSIDVTYQKRVPVRP